MPLSASSAHQQNRDQPPSHNSNGSSAGGANGNSNGTASPRENGAMMMKKMEQDRMGLSGGVVGPHSPRSGTSSNASTPSSNKKMEDKPSTPVAKSVTPTNSNGMGGSGMGGAPPPSGAGSLVKSVAKPPLLNAAYPHYLGPLNGAAPHDLQAYAAAAAIHNNLPPGLNNYPRAPLQVGFDPHPQMRAPLGAPPPSMAGAGGGAPPGSIPGGKP